jgi:hypothetical protein
MFSCRLVQASRVPEQVLGQAQGQEQVQPLVLVLLALQDLVLSRLRPASLQ